MDNWVGLGALVLTALGGGAGIGQLWRVWQDRRMAISERESKSAELDIREDDAIDARWREFVKTHGDLIVKPLREELDRLRKDVERQGTEIATLKGELDKRNRELESERTAHWRAISYIRELLFYIRTHMPDAGVAIPEPHADIASDI